MKLLYRWLAGDYISLLFALRKKEQYEARGFTAFVHRGFTLSDGDVWEVYTLPKKKNHGDFIT